MTVKNLVNIFTRCWYKWFYWPSSNFVDSSANFLYWV